MDINRSIVYIFVIPKNILKFHRIIIRLKHVIKYLVVNKNDAQDIVNPRFGFGNTLN